MKTKIPFQAISIFFFFWGNTPGKPSKKWRKKQCSGEFCSQLADLVGIDKWEMRLTVFICICIYFGTGFSPVKSYILGMTISSATELGGNGPSSAGLMFSIHHWGEWVLEQAQRCCGVFSKGDIPNPPGHNPERRARGDAAWAERLDSVISSGPFQLYPFWILWFIQFSPTVPSGLWIFHFPSSVLRKQQG